MSLIQKLYENIYGSLKNLIVLTLPDDTEHVDVCIIGGEVNKDRSGSTVQPKAVHQLHQYGSALLLGPAQILIVACSTVCGQQAPVRGTFDLFLCVVLPAKKAKEQDCTSTRRAVHQLGTTN